MEHTICARMNARERFLCLPSTGARGDADEAQKASVFVAIECLSFRLEGGGVLCDSGVRQHEKASKTVNAENSEM